MNRHSNSDEQVLKASTFISSNCRGRVEVEGEEIEDIEMEAASMATEILEPMMTTTKVEGELLTNLKDRMLSLP